MSSEETPPPPLSSFPRWTGDSIARLSLHRRAPLFARLDALPFLALYLALAAYIWTYSVTRLVASTLLATCLMLHLLAFLVQHWSAKARAFTSFITIKHVDPRQVENGTTYAFVTPREHKAQSQLVQIQVDKKNRVYFTFRKELYKATPEQNTFEKVLCLTRLAPSRYMAAARATGGLPGERLVRIASRFRSTMPSEETPLLSRSRSPRWTGDSIARLSLHRRAPLLARLDALPFLAFYLALAAYVWTYSVTRLVASFLFSTCLMLHLLAFLVQHWSANACAFISWITIKHVDPRQVENGTIYALVTPRQHQEKSQLVQIQIDENNQVYFTFQNATYEFNPELNTYEKVPARLPLSYYTSVARKTNGLSGERLLHSARRFGSNKLEIPLPTFAELYKENLLTPHFVFRVFWAFLWLLDKYWKVSLLMLILILIVDARVVSVRLRCLRKLRGKKNPSQTVQVFRYNKWAPISSLELLPGDIVSIGLRKDCSNVVPCDVLILSGTALVSEAMLTGDRQCKWKQAVSPAEADSGEVLDVAHRHKNHVLFGGTMVVRHTPAVVSDATPVAKAPDSGCVCYVLRTGFDTLQGKTMTTRMYASELVSALIPFDRKVIGLMLMFAIPAYGYLLYHRYSEGAADAGGDAYGGLKGILYFPVKFLQQRKEHYEAKLAQPMRAQEADSN